MRRLTWLFLMVLILLAAGWAQASAFNPKHVPEDAKWVIHIDMDALRTTQTWKLVDPAIQSNPAFARGIADIQTVSGLQFPQGFHDLTLYGTSFKEDTLAIVVHATLDEPRLLAGVQSDPQYTAGRRGTRDVHGWHDKGKPMYGAFCGDEIMVISNNPDPVNTFIDAALDGKVKTLKADAGIAAGAKAGLFAYIAGDDLAELKQAQTPLVKDVELAWLCAGERENGVVLRASLGAKTPEAAAEIKKLAEGVQAFVILSSKGENVQAPVKLLAEVIQAAKISIDGKVVTAECPLPIDTVKKLIDLALAQQNQAPPAAK